MKNYIEAGKQIFGSGYKTKKEDFTNRIASDIGYSILNHFKGDYDRTYDILNNCKITDIQAKRKRKKIIVDITLSRPGILIGKKGRFIIYITEYLKENNNGFEVVINLKETKRWSYHLYPMTWDEAKEIGGF